MRLPTLHDLTLGMVLKIFFLAILLTSLIAYVHFQARNILSGPTIALTNDPAPLQHERVVTLTGEAKNIVKLTLNGREIHTDEHGNFREELVLENGYTIMTLYAEDRFGRSISLTREYVYVPTGGV